MGFFDGGFGAVGGLVQALTSIGSAKRQANRQKELMAYQDKLQDENYARELADKERLIAEDREYTSIGAQMQRARDAGVSPLAALGVSQGSSISGSAPASGAVSVPAAAPDSLQMVGQGLATSVNGALDAQIKSEQVKQMKLQNEYDSLTMDSRVRLQNAIEEGQNLTNKLTGSNIELTESQSKYFQNSASYLESLKNRVDKMTPLECDKLRAEYDKLMAEVTSLDINNAQLNEMLDAQIQSIRSATYQALSDAYLKQQQGKYVGYEAYSRRMDSESRQKANELQKQYNDAYAKSVDAEKAWKEADAAYKAGKLSLEERDKKRRFYLDCGKAICDIAFKGAALYFSGGMAAPFLAGESSSWNGKRVPPIKSLSEQDEWIDTAAGVFGD